MTDPDIRAINRAIAEVEDQDIREAARTSLHHIFRREAKLEVENDRLRKDLGQIEANRDSLLLRVEETEDELAEWSARALDAGVERNQLREENVSLDNENILLDQEVGRLQEKLVRAERIIESQRAALRLNGART